MKKKVKIFSYLILCVFALITVFKVSAMTKTTKVGNLPSELKNVTLIGGDLTYAENSRGKFKLQKKYNDNYFAMCTLFGRYNTSVKVDKCSAINSGWSADKNVASGVAAIILAGSGGVNNSMTEEEYYYTELAINRYLSSTKYKKSENSFGTLKKGYETKLNNLVNKGKSAEKKSKSFSKVSVMLGQFNCDSDKNCVANVVISNKTSDTDLGSPIVTLNGKQLSTADYLYKGGQLTIKNSAYSIDTSSEGTKTFDVKISFKTKRTRYIAKNYNCDTNKGKNQTVTPNLVEEESQTKTISDSSKFSWKVTINNTNVDFHQSIDYSIVLYKVSLYNNEPLGGAAITFDITENDTVTSSVKAPLQFSGKADESDVGNIAIIETDKSKKYVLSNIKEVSVPKGYKSGTIADIIKPANEVSTERIINTPDNSIIIKKLDGDNKQYVSGATLTLSTSENGTVGFKYVTNAAGEKLVEDGNYVAKISFDSDALTEWVTDAEHGMKFIELPYEEEFVVTELDAPEGYIVNNPISTFTLTVDNKDQKLDVIDYASSVTISKQDITSKQELAGAKLQVVDAQGNEYASWTSTNEPHEIKDLADGTYYLVETTAPDGYELNTEKIEFSMENGKSSTSVVMYNSPKKVSVPNTFSVKNIITYIVGGILIAFGTGVLIYELKKKKA